MREKGHVGNGQDSDMSFLQQGYEEEILVLQNSINTGSGRVRVTFRLLHLLLSSLAFSWEFLRFNTA
jgi:hypothetical protein